MNVCINSREFGRSFGREVERIVRAFLGHLTLLKYDDAIRPARGSQTVAYHNHDAFAALRHSEHERGKPKPLASAVFGSRRVKPRSKFRRNVPSPCTLSH